MVPITLARGWTLDVERGPEGLIVRPHRTPPAACEPTDFPAESRAEFFVPDDLPIAARIGSDSTADQLPAFAELVWSVLQQNFGHRLVLEMGDFDSLDSHLLAELIWLYQQIQSHDGMMRICGLSSANQALLHESRLQERLPTYRDRAEAIMGSSRPNQPR